MEEIRNLTKKIRCEEEQSLGYKMALKRVRTKKEELSMHYPKKI